MYPILYEDITSARATIGNSSTHGVGVLKDAISCEVHEERNGEYELTLKYPAHGIFASNLIPRAIIKAKPNFNDGPQLFRIYKVGKVMGSSFTVNARHISYDLSGNSILSGNADNVVDALEILEAASAGYTFSTDKTLSAPFKISTPSSVRSWFAGKAGSILDKYGPGEWHYDNFNIEFLANRGSNRGVVIRFGKNLLSLKDTIDSSNLVTAVIAYWQSDDANPITVLSETVTTGLSLDVGVVQVIDATAEYFEQPTTAQLTSYARSYVNSHNMTGIKKNLKLDFVQLKTLTERVDLCDTVRIVYEDYNIDVNAKCIATTWDTLNDRYVEAEFGEPKTNIVDTITSISKSVDEGMTVQQVKTIVKEVGEIIIGSQGGYVFINDKDLDGYPDELLIMNNVDIAFATKIWRWDVTGLAYSDDGYLGTFDNVMSMDGYLRSDFIKGDLVIGGTSGLEADHKFEVKDTNNNVMVSFSKANGIIVKANDFEAYCGRYPSTYDRVRVASIDTDPSTSTVTDFGGLIYDQRQTGSSNYAPANAGIGRITSSDTSIAFVKSHKYLTTDPPNESYIKAGDNEAGLENVFVNSLQKFISMLKTTRVGTVVTSVVKAIAGTNIYFSATSNDSGSSKGTTVEVKNGTSNYVNINATDSSNGITMPNISLNASNGNVTCTSVTQTSSKKVKKNIKSLTEKEAKKILELRPVTFDFKDKNLGSDKRGFIAEEVKEIIPELVNEGEVVSLDYIAMIPYLVKMIQSQQKEIDELKNKLKGE